MKHVYDTVESGNPLRAVVGATVQVNYAGGGPAVIYDDLAGTILATNPVTTDARGAYSFYAPDDLYDLIYQGTRLTTLAVPNLEFASSTASQFFPKTYGAKGDGVTDDSGALQAAITAAAAAGGGTVVLGAHAYSLGTTGLVIPNTVNLFGIGYASQLLYAGTGSAVRLTGSQFAMIGRLGVVTSADAGTAFEAGNATRQPLFVNVYAVGPTTLTNTGAGFYLNAGTGFSGGLTVLNANVVGYKYGVRCQSANLTTDTWTAMDFTSLWASGRAAGVVAGSAGIYFDANTNAIGTQWRGGTIESYALGVQHLNGGYGGTIDCDMEGNTADVSVGASFKGRITIGPTGATTWYGGPVTVTTGGVAVGVNPATVGGLRLPNSGSGSPTAQIMARNGANTVDYPILELYSDNHVYTGASGVCFVGGGSSNTQDLGLAAARWRTVYLGTSVVNAGFYEGTEMTAPAAGAVNTGRVYFEDSGGKTRMMVRFNTGAAVQLAIEP